MCGITVIFMPTDGEVDVSLLQAMTTAVAHRGPDDYGYGFSGPSQDSLWRDDSPGSSLRGPGVAMGHRRLSILDLSPAGRQPFVSHDRRFWLLYNGEIFNYLELRSELSKLGQLFITGTDTEVVLAAYATWGPDCFRRFNGEWALVLWDAQEQRIVVSRDRFGIKPLFYAQIGPKWIFASEVKSIFLHPGISTEPNQRAVASFLTRNGGAPPGESFFRHVHSVEPGTWMSVGRDGSNLHRYWELPSPGAERLSDITEATHRLSNLLTDAVRLRVRSDVRVGTMVSGGLDSTSVLTEMSKLLRTDSTAQIAIGDKLQGFHASFPDLEIDEASRVRELSTSLALRVHTVYPLQESDVPGVFEHTVRHMERPFSNSVPLVHTLLMRRAGSVGVKVVLNGHGADEVFGGYPDPYTALAMGDDFHRRRFTRVAAHLWGIRRRQGLSSWQALAQLLDQILPHRLTFWNRPWRASETLPLVRAETRALAAQSMPRFKGHSMLDSALRNDFLHRILPGWLDMEDRISMSASIESRVPFLDHRIVELGFSLEDALKINAGTTKYALRRVVGPRLPQSIANEKHKFRFSGPDAVWLQGPLRPLLTEWFLYETPLVAEYLDPEQLRTEVENLFAGDTRKSRVIWMAFNTEAWLRHACSGNT